MKPIFILVGIPGSGKNTQAERLSFAIRIPHIDIGDTITEYLSSQPDFSENMSTGPFPSERMLQVLAKKLETVRDAKGLIITHHYHPVEEIDMKNSLYSNLGFEVRKVFALEISREISIKRSIGRLNGNFNAKEPSEERIIQRIDRYITLRDAYKRYYQKLNILVEISAEQDREEVFVQIRQHLGKDYGL